MSTASAIDHAIATPTPVRLRLVAPLAPERVGRGAFTMMAIAVMALGLLAILFVNTMVAQGGFALVELKAEQSGLHERRQGLEASIALAAAPAALEASARALGMVQGKAPAFLRVTDGRVLGKAAPARGRKAAADKATVARPDPA